MTGEPVIQLSLCGGRLRSSIVKITYDKDVRALYIQVADGDVKKTVEMREGVIADFGKGGQLIGIEIINEQEFLSFVSEQKRGEFVIPDIHAV